MGCISKIKFDCIVGDGAHASIKRVEDGIPYLTSKNFKLEGIDLSDLSFISKSDYEKHFKEKSKALTKPRPKDIIFSIIGSIGSPYIVRETDSFGISSSVAILRPLENLDTKYLYYYLKNSGVQNYVEAIKSGSAQGFLSLEMIKSIPLDYPPLPEQQRIASILSAYDDLIEVNNKRIALLEQMAEQIYKEWFVRMRFPGYQDAEFEKGVPKGWDICNCSVFIEFKKGKNITADTAISGNVPVVAGGIEPAYFHNKANTKSPTITISASGASAGFVKLYYEDIWASDCSFIDTLMTEYIFYNYLHLKIRQSEIYFLQKGSAQPHVYPKDLMAMKMLLPNLDLIEKFEKLITTFFHEIKNLGQQVIILKQTRDLLLPRLISGKLRVKDIPEPQTVSA
jgi:type I restriction enzyme S subunit